MKQFFSQYGLKNTKSRNLVYQLLKKSNKPMTADDIYKVCQDFDQSINLSTIYRILDVFLEKKIILKPFVSDESKACFVINNHQHKHYLVCDQCKKMIEIENCPFEEYEKEIEQKTDFIIKHHKLELIGICPACKQKNLEE